VNLCPLSCSVSEIVRYWSKITDFNLTHLYLATPLAVIHWNFAENFGCTKLDSITLRCFRGPSYFGTLRATDRRTHDDSIYRANIVITSDNMAIL